MILAALGALGPDMVSHSYASSGPDGIVEVRGCSFMISRAAVRGGTSQNEYLRGQLRGIGNRQKKVFIDLSSLYFDVHTGPHRGPGEPQDQRGCGYCSHPGYTDGICTICGKPEQHEQMELGL